MTGIMFSSVDTPSLFTTLQICSDVTRYSTLLIAKSSDTGTLYPCISVRRSVTKPVIPSTTDNAYPEYVLTAAGNSCTCSVNIGIAYLITSLSSPITPASRPLPTDGCVSSVYTLSRPLLTCVATTGSVLKLPIN